MDLAYISQHLDAFMPLIVFLILEISLLVAALMHISKAKTFPRGNKNLWIFVAVALPILGPLLYFFLGKGEL